MRGVVGQCERVELVASSSPLAPGRHPSSLVSSPTLAQDAVDSDRFVVHLSYSPHKPQLIPLSCSLLPQASRPLSARLAPSRCAPSPPPRRAPPSPPTRPSRQPSAHRPSR